MCIFLPIWRVATTITSRPAPGDCCCTSRSCVSLEQQTGTRGYTIIPLRLYYKRGRVKVELGVGRGKRQYEKRQTLAAREAQREMDRAIRSHGR